MCLKDQLKEQEMAPDLFSSILMSEILEELKSDPDASELVKMLLDDENQAEKDLDPFFNLDLLDVDLSELEQSETILKELSHCSLLGYPEDDDTVPDFKNPSMLDEDPTAPTTPEMYVLVDPRKVSGIFEAPPEVKEVSRDVRLNNGISDYSEDESSNGEHTLVVDEVHVDHCYSFMPKLTKVKVEPVPEVAEPVPARRPVGRPRKCTALPKRYAAEFEEEIVDVESIQVKRTRRAPPKAKPSSHSLPKRRGRKPNVDASSSSASYEPVASCSYATDSNGFVMRQAKNSAIKKIAKTKNSSAVSRSKRNDHNDMERRRRHEMKQLFDQLRVKIPGHLLKDTNGKIKKNPSKNTILIGSRKHLCNIHEERAEKIALLQQRSALLKRAEKLRRKLRKHQLYW